MSRQRAETMPVVHAHLSLSLPDRCCVQRIKWKNIQSWKDTSERWVWYLQPLRPLKSLIISGQPTCFHWPSMLLVPANGAEFRWQRAEPDHDNAGINQMKRKRMKWSFTTCIPCHARTCFRGPRQPYSVKRRPACLYVCINQNMKQEGNHAKKPGSNRVCTLKRRASLEEPRNHDWSQQPQRKIWCGRSEWLS